MSNINLIIEERAADIGKFLVGRLLPFRQKRMVGPFIYIDHMGPVKLSERDNFDVLPHPHIGLSTLTFLFEGSIMHRDTLGNELEIKPGEVNLMTAGSGIVHSERTPEHLRNSEKFLHGLQIWIALPKHLEQMKPEFFHISADEIPCWEKEGLQFKLIAGEAFNRKSGVPVFSKLYMIEIKSDKTQKVTFDEHLYGESGLYILEGGVESDGNVYKEKQMLVTKESHLCEFTIQANSTVYIFGGEPFPEQRFIDWNFVSSDKQLIAEAKQKWIDRQFDTIKGEESDYIPYPSFPKR
jgi:redox-sensitive bicupin YhaK (pirin superfamily)